MNSRLTSINNELIALYKTGKFVTKSSRVVKNFQLLSESITIKIGEFDYFTFYSTEYKKVVLGYTLENMISYLSFSTEKVDIDLNALPKFEWHDRYIFTFND